MVAQRSAGPPPVASRPRFPRARAHASFRAMTCPCGSPRSFDSCCGPFHSGGERNPPTAEALMRSRYTAYARADIDYIARTLAPESRGDLDPGRGPDLGHGSVLAGIADRGDREGASLGRRRRRGIRRDLPAARRDHRAPRTLPLPQERGRAMAVRRRRDHRKEGRRQRFRRQLGAAADGGSEGRAQLPLPVWQRQEVQGLLQSLARARALLQPRSMTSVVPSGEKMQNEARASRPRSATSATRTPRPVVLSLLPYTFPKHKDRPAN